MGNTLREIAEQLRDSDKKVQLIYAFNGSGKTRLSREFKELVAPKSEQNAEDWELANKKIVYYNAFTEDLFYWDNDLQNDAEPKLKIQPNSFTDWVFNEQGQEIIVTNYLQRFLQNKLTPKFSNNYSEVTFSFEGGHEGNSEKIKISKGEESCFVWSVFRSLLNQVVEVLNTADISERETDKLNQLKYVFIDDPVASLDQSHLIELAVNLAELIKSSESNLKFFITTHSIDFYNVMYNETKQKNGYILRCLEDNTFELEEVKGDSNKCLFYHLHLKKEIEKAVAASRVERQHFMYLRNLYEKTASFLGYPYWSELLPDDQAGYYKRITQFASHSTVISETIAEPTPQEKQTVRLLPEHLINSYHFWKES